MPVQPCCGLAETFQLRKKTIKFFELKKEEKKSTNSIPKYFLSSKVGDKTAHFLKITVQSYIYGCFVLTACHLEYFILNFIWMVGFSFFIVAAWRRFLLMPHPSPGSNIWAISSIWYYEECCSEHFCTGPFFLIELFLRSGSLGLKETVFLCSLLPDCSPEIFEPT